MNRVRVYLGALFLVAVQIAPASGQTSGWRVRLLEEPDVSDWGTVPGVPAGSRAMLLHLEVTTPAEGGEAGRDSIRVVDADQRVYPVFSLGIWKSEVYQLAAGVQFRVKNEESQQWETLISITRNSVVFTKKVTQCYLLFAVQADASGLVLEFGDARRALKYPAA